MVRLSLDDVEPFPYGPPVSAAIAGAGVASSLAPTVAIVRGPRLAGAIGLALQIAARAASNEVCPTPRRAWPVFPAGALTLSVLSLVSSVDRLRGGVVWRGRHYGPDLTGAGNTPGAGIPSSGRQASRHPQQRSDH
jgi:hypothetical protein